MLHAHYPVLPPPTPYLPLPPTTCITTPPFTVLPHYRLLPPPPPTWFKRTAPGSDSPVLLPHHVPCDQRALFAFHAHCGSRYWWFVAPHDCLFALVCRFATPHTPAATRTPHRLPFSLYRVPCTQRFAVCCHAFPRIPRAPHTFCVLLPRFTPTTFTFLLFILLFTLYAYTTTRARSLLRVCTVRRLDFAAHTAFSFRLLPTILRSFTHRTVFLFARYKSAFVYHPTHIFLLLYMYFSLIIDIHHIYISLLIILRYIYMILSLYLSIFIILYIYILWYV